MNKFFCKSLLAIFFLLGSVFLHSGEAWGQSRGDAFCGTSEEINKGYDTGSQTEEITNGAAPILQGATPGTIGPTGADATSIMGVNTAAATRSSPDSNPRPAILGAFFLIGLASCGYTIFKRSQEKKNSLWVNGGIIAVLLLCSGFAWGSFL